MSSDNGDVASSTSTLQKEDVIILKIKDIVLDERKNVSHIGSYPIKRITLNNVRFFMSANSIKLNSKTKKCDLVERIANAKLEYDRSVDSLLPKNAGTKPSFITTDNTFIRVIQCNFDPTVREHMQSLGNCKSCDELDTRGDNNSAYEALLNIYCDEVKIPDMPLAECDKISTQKAISQGLKYINEMLSFDKVLTSFSIITVSEVR